MSSWTDAERWAQLLSATGCPICRAGGPKHVVAELETSWVAMDVATPPLPGTCALFLRRHAVELHDLPPDEAAAYLRDLQRLSRAVQAATGAVKLNYEIHGNTIPHLHTHLFPRYVGDPFEGTPIDPRAAPAGHPHFASVTHAEVRQRLASALADA